MNLLKTLGLGMYYRLRRIVKAVKNWKKFGVIIFGSMFLAGSLFGMQMADAQGSFHVSLSPTNSAITLGQSKLFTAQAFNGIDNVTSATSFAWTASKGGQTIAQSTGTTWNFTPTAVGVYTMNVRGTHANGEIAFADTPGTLTVSTPPTPEVHLTVSLYPTATNPITLGQSKLYTAQAFNGTTSVTANSTFAWIASKSGQTMAQSTGTTWNFTPTSVGTYTINVRGTHTPSGAMAFADTPATLVVQTTPPPAPACSLIRIAQPTNPIYVGENRVISWSAKNSDDTNVPANKVGWTLTGGGTWNAATSTFSATQVGNFILTGYCVDKPSVSASVVLQVRMREVPPTETCASIDIWAQNLVLYRNNQVTIGYTALTNYGQPVSNGDLLWNWTGGAFNTATKVYTATQVGDFMLTARCQVNPSISDSVAIHVSELIIQEDYLNSTDIWADRTSLCLNEIANLSAQARNNHGQVISDATYTWTWSGVGYLTGDTHSQYNTRYASSNTPGWATVTVTASWHGQSVSNSLMVQVRDCTPVPSPYFIDGSIVATTNDGQPACTGSLINYVVTLTDRYATVHNVRLSLVLPTGVTLLSTTSAVDNPRVSGRTVFWEPGTLIQGQSVILRIQVSVNDDIQMGSNLKVNAFVQADEKPNGFYLDSNDLWVRCGGPTPEPLPPTGASAWILAGLAVISLGLAGLTYYWLDRRMNRVS